MTILLLKQTTTNGSTLFQVHTKQWVQTVTKHIWKCGNICILWTKFTTNTLVAASNPLADTYCSFTKCKMFLQRCWFRSVCRAPDKTHLVVSQRRAETVKVPLLYYFVMTTEGIIKKKVVRICYSLANLSAPGADFSGNTNLWEGPPAAAHSWPGPDCWVLMWQRKWTHSSLSTQFPWDQKEIHGAH